MDCSFNLVGPTFVTGLILGFLYALIALGYTMVYGVLRLINFAHDAVFMIGGVAVYYIMGQIFGLASPEVGVGLVTAVLGFLLVGAIASASGASTLEYSVYRPLRRRNAARLSFLIGAIGASFFTTYLMQENGIFGLNIFLGPAKRQFPAAISPEPAFTVFRAQVLNVDVLLVVTAIVCLFLLDRLINQTRTGRSIRALSEDVVAAQLMGVNVSRVIQITFIIGGLFAGIAGTLYGMKFGNVAWNMGFIPGIKAFTAAVLGGIGNIRGAMLGGLLLGLIENMSVVCIGAQWKNVIAFMVLVLILILRPTGVLGERVGG